MQSMAGKADICKGCPGRQLCLSQGKHVSNNTVATAPVLVAMLQLECWLHTFAWGVLTHALYHNVIEVPPKFKCKFFHRRYRAYQHLELSFGHTY